MWFHSGFENFLLKKSENVDFCDIFISDCVRIWHKTLTNNELLSIFQTLNPLIEVSDHKLKDITLNMLQNAETQKEMKVEGSSIILKTESKMLGLKFRFQVSLIEGSNEMFYKEFTVPLLIMIINTQNREKKLMKLIEDKDTEIEEYKQECGVIKSYLMATKPFSKKEFDCQYPNIHQEWDSSSFFNCISKLLSSENVCEDKHVKTEIKEKKDECFTVKKHEKRPSVFTDKSLNEKIGHKPCVTLGNQILKKKRMVTEKSKLKL